MKKISSLLLMLSFLLGSVSLTSCDDFFDPDSDDELNGESYISSSTEMYTGFLGIMTKVQAVGDKEILLTDTRGEMLEPSENSSSELIAIYNYDADLQGNSYANPNAYYEVVIACNDYIKKMEEYRDKPGVDKEVCADLISSAMRIKVWVYKTIAEIYGKAVWFDDAVTKVQDITSLEGYQLMDIKQVVDKCLSLLEGGYNGVLLNREINWIAWLDPSNVTNIAGSQYRKWNWMIPAYDGLLAELCLWKGAVLDAAGQDATTYYKKAADQLLAAIGVYVNDEGFSGSKPYWLPNANTRSDYRRYWDSAQPYPQETASALIYDYTKNQTNSLLRHFSNEFPNEYLLRPSVVAQARFTDATFNPGATTGDPRESSNVRTNAGQLYVSKYRPVGSSARTNAYQDDVQIYIYRATHYHVMLAEALNHLKRFKAMNCVINTGIKAVDYVEGDAEWEGFTKNWTPSADWGTRKYASLGLRGCYQLQSREFKTTIGEEGDMATIRFNDEALLNEMMLEFACEGKIYPTMNRMALRYNDLSIVADRVCPKYVEAGKDADIRSKIMAGGNWVPYDLMIK